MDRTQPKSTAGQSGATADVRAQLQAEEASTRETLSPWKITRRRFMRHRLAVASLVFFTLLVATVFIWGALLPEGTARTADYDLIRQPPSLQHPMGTDQAGSDVMQRIILGGRVSLTVGILAMAISILLGTLVGAVAGYYGGGVDNVLMRIVDLMLSIPSLFLIIILAGVIGPGMRTIILVIGITGWMGVARIVRANFLSLKNKEFVEAARSIGVRDFPIIFKHILPNTVAPIIVAATLGVAGAILSEAYVSFLGFGIQPPQPSWGNMVSPGSFLLTITQAPWIILFPGLMITITVLTVNFIGDGLRDALDPFSRL
ncbi:MAG: ABC transporter permease [Chloroflexota bacterium]|nr:ABC transporter permease [Chloroflexota bacterium]